MSKNVASVINVNAKMLPDCSHNKQASNIYLLMQVEGLVTPDGADVDLRLGCPRLNIFGTNIPGTHLPTPRGWTAELAFGYVYKQFRRLG